MNLKSKLLLSFSLVLITIFSVVEFFGYHQTRSQMLAELRLDALKIRDVLVAVREVYQYQFLDSGLPLTKKTVGFLPAHSMNRISKKFQDINKSGLVFNNVSDRPRNPENQADEVELQAMAYFRGNPKEKERMVVFTNDQGLAHYHFSAPLWIEERCLKCHGDSDDAPETIRNTYNTAFNYKLGELRGLLSIKLPTYYIEEKVLSQRLNEIWGRLAAFAITFFFGAWLLHRLIIRRLALLHSAAGEIAKGDYTERLPVQGGDELCNLAEAFNNMSDQRYRAELLQMESEKQVLDLLNSTAEAIYGLDLNGNCTFANPACVRMLGYQSSEELVGLNMHELTHHTRPDGSPYSEKDCPIQNAFVSGTGSHADHEVLWRADGECFPVEYWSYPIRRDNRIMGAVVTFLDITERKQQEEQILRQAHFDALTNLPNRFLTIDRLSQLLLEAKRDHEHVAVLFLDLDDFKKVNDTLGHNIGDKLLVEAALRLRNLVRSGDTVGRLGGDEFIVLLGALQCITDIRPVVENLLKGFRDAFIIDGRELVLTMSAGIAVYPDDGEGPSELLRKADSAMYHSKDQGRNTYSFFTDAMNQEVSRRVALEEQMLGALDRGEFRLCYQPIVAVESRMIVGFEALLRWYNPSLGEVSPEEFIIIAEQNGLILPIGDYVLTEALQMLAKWQHYMDETFSMAINLSPRQFRDPNLVTFIKDAICESGVSYESLRLEITEGVLMSGQAYINDALNELDNLGIGMAMDDFGTGYSSLSYLRRFPFNTLKVDRSFINDLTVDTADRELVSATIAMAHSLGLMVIAEGVETEEQLALLGIDECDYAQGYLFSKPVTPDKMLEILETQKSL
ncbi:MAG: EAL domain-containing protein [Candidatus Thiodiazotropha sp. (ex Codakia rugifera)]|nr:EAL domain-containing protein [Candidatus Thiodiazotropha sp. (ex Codakia rugifera)]